MRIGEVVTIPTGPFAGQMGKVTAIDLKRQIAKVVPGTGNLSVDVSLAMLEAAERGEEELEMEAAGTKKRRLEAAAKKTGEDKTKKPEAKPRPAAPATPATAATTPPPTNSVTTVVKINENGGNVKMIPTQQNAPARVEPLYCPLDGKTRRRPADLVCGDCYRTYTNEAAVGLARGNFNTLFEWVAGKAPNLVTSLEKEYAAAQAAVENLSNVVVTEVKDGLRQSAGGREIAKEVWNQAFRTKKTELWRAKGGNAKYAQMKGLEGRISLLREIIKKSLGPKPETPATPPATAATTPPPATTTPPAPPLTSEVDGKTSEVVVPPAPKSRKPRATPKPKAAAKEAAA